MLCAACSSIFTSPEFSKISVHDHELRNRDLQTLHGNFLSLQRSLAAGCRLCHRFVAALAERNTRPWANNAINALAHRSHLLAESDLKPSWILRGTDLCPGIEAGSFRLQYRLAYELDSRTVISCVGVFRARKGEMNLREQVELFLFKAAEQSPLVDEVVLDAHNGINTTSMETIKSWITNCDINHSACCVQAETASPRRFARILNVGECEDPTEVQICPAEHLPSTIRYITLSHCWGGTEAEIPSLTTKNYDEYLHRIEVAGLPRTFREVIQLTCRLGIRYIWIDSLCIIQDSEQDWLDQAMIMGEVYRGSYMNVAATKALNPYEGLFTERNHFALSPLRVWVGRSPQGLMSLDTRTSRNCPLLWLKEGHFLVAIPQDSRADHAEIDLNTCLGNADGTFEEGDGAANFLLSAKNVHLSKSILSAELRTLTGEWRHRKVDLKTLVGETTLPTHFQLHGSTLKISTYQYDEPHYPLDLNKYLGNADGAFDISGMNFGLSARSIDLAGTVLSADLRTRNGQWRRSQIDLQSYLDLSVEPIGFQTNNETVHEAFYDIQTDTRMRWSKAITVAELSSRAWVVQERALAPRILHFAQEQLFWECESCLSLEERAREEVDHHGIGTKPISMDFKGWNVYSEELVRPPRHRPLGVNYIWSSVKAMYGRDNVEFRKHDLARDPILLKQARQMCYGSDEWQTTDPLVRYWSAIVVNYSGSKLTYINDRLTAIAGLAQVLSSRTGVRYVAGLWMTQFPRQLLWRGRSILQRQQDVYVAPSWSWASFSSSITPQGMLLEPILETKGAMDLIKVLAVDMESVSKSDSATFRQVESRLRLRGRLLPVKLDMGLWPQGETRKSALLQTWSTSVFDPPVRETFIVPVLFTRWNRSLPDGTPNSLLLEWTGEKGVFRRIGTCRLSNRCDLRKVVPDLYKADIKYHEDEDDGADTDGEAFPEDAESPHADRESRNEPTPHDEFYAKQMRWLASDRVQSVIDQIQAKAKTMSRQFQTLSKALSLNSHLDERTRAAYEDLLKRLDAVCYDNPGRLIQCATSELPREPIEPTVNLDWRPEDSKLVKDVTHNMLGMDINFDFAVRNTMWVPRSVEKLEPKTAVENRYYLDYAEDDEDAIRYGHFTFEIV